ncbi:MAG TPA: adenosylhomocysteinase [Acidobacteriota bacterium]
MTSLIRDPALAPGGQEKIEWVARHSPVLTRLLRDPLADGTLAGLRIGVSMPLEAKTAYLAWILKQAGAEVAVAGTAPGYVQDDVAAALVQRGVMVFASSEHDRVGFQRCFEALADLGCDLFIDDRGELTHTAHTSRRAALSRLRGASEQTTSGVTRLKAMAEAGRLDYPVLAANDARCKYLFDNRHGTGQSALAAMLKATNLFLGGAEVVVAGYGWCGRGLAHKAKGLGARVTVCEVDPVRALEAHTDGFEVAPMLEAAQRGRFFLTATGCRHVLDRQHFERMPDGVVLANAGGVDIEINVPALHAAAVERQELRPHLVQYRLGDGRRINLVAEGRLVNLAAADGHPIEIMDLSFSVQALAAHHLARCHRDYAPGVHPLPAEIDLRIARIKLESLGCAIDALSAEQKAFLADWSWGEPA